MADSAVDNKDAAPVVEKEVEKPVSTEEVADEDSKQSENGDAKLKENGDKVEDEEEESKDGENGDSTDGLEACPVKRKSAAGDAPEGAPTEGASPEKKAKLEEKQTAEAESNGGEAKAAA